MMENKRISGQVPQVVPQPIRKDGAGGVDRGPLDILRVTDWFAHTPKEVLSANFGVPESAFSAIPPDQLYIYKSTIPGPLQTQAVESPYGSKEMQEPSM